MQTGNEKNRLVAAQGDFPLSRFAYAACATPPGTSGLAVIRMSGPASFDIAEALFRSRSPESVSVHDMKGYTCAYGDFKDPETLGVIDTVVMTKFIAPNSYTGEDTIEISCHGGTAVKNAVLDALFALGAVPAAPGEFTKHAFLNGKMDLSQAEAVMDLISASSAKAGMEAARQLQGVLSAKIRDISRILYTVMAKVEMIVEFPEHEETVEATDEIASSILGVSWEVDQLIRSFRQGRLLKEGMKVVIAGRPNAGKSSMLNTLSGMDRAIVTPVPGTTRDTVEELVDIEGIPVRLIDTAGLRESADEVEQKGIGRALQAMEDADLIFWISSEDDMDQPELPEQVEDLKAILSRQPAKTLVLILGKSDRTLSNKDNEGLRTAFPNAPVIPFSSVTQEGVLAVRDQIRKKYESDGAGSAEEILLTNARHFLAATEAKRSLEMALEGISMHLPVDLLASALRNAADSLALITGDTVSEEVVQEIFSRFCIGK